MSKVRINDLAREMEVKSRQILDILTELGMGAGKTHSSSLEGYEADSTRAFRARIAVRKPIGFVGFARSAGHCAQD